MRDAIAHDPRRRRARGARASRRGGTRERLDGAARAGTRRRRGEASRATRRRTPRASRRSPSSSDLVPSGGSDWHGAADGPRTIGMMQVPAEWLALQDARLVAAGRAPAA